MPTEKLQGKLMKTQGTLTGLTRKRSSTYDEPAPCWTFCKKDLNTSNTDNVGVQHPSLASTRLANPTVICGNEQFVHVVLFFSCTSTHIRDIRTFSRHEHQVTCMIGSETAAFVAQDTVESRERSLYCRSGDWQQQQSPKCCR